MKRNYVLIAIFCISFVCISSISLAGTYSGGAGLVGDPYQISSSADINELMNTSGDWGSYFIVTQNIDCSSASWSSGNPKPIGNGATSFTGHFDGQGFTISNITYIEDFSYSLSYAEFGFFGFIFGGNISNLNLDNFDIQNHLSNSFGIFCGKNDSGIITNCSSQGKVDGMSPSGGFCGVNTSGTITNCSSIAEVNGSGSLGGFCGINYLGIISYCYCTSNVSGSAWNGGFCGQNYNGIINYCYSTGQVNSSDSNIGGFCGENRNSGQISYCYSSCSVTAVYDYVGGFCGNTYNNANISNCYSTGDVSGRDGVGGFIGQISFPVCSLENCYSTGRVTASGSNYGGFCGRYIMGSFTCCFWNITTSGMSDGVGAANPDPSGVTGLTNGQFSDPSNFSCFDFGNDWIMPSSLRYGDRFGNYPILRSILFTFFIPTLTEWAIILFIGLLAGVGSWFVWRKLV